MRSARIIGWAALLPAFWPVAAAERVLRLDPEATQIGFVLKATAHRVHGTLRLRDGYVRFDDETGRASGEITVDARLAETGNAKRDRKMHEKVLESERYPLFRFTPSGITGRLAEEGRSEIELSGTMSVHGVGHPMTVRAEVQIVERRLSAGSSFSIPYVEWGLRDPSVFLLRVAKSVEVTLRTEGMLEAPSGAED